MRRALLVMAVAFVVIGLATMGVAGPKASPTPTPTATPNACTAHTTTAGLTQLQANVIMSGFCQGKTIAAIQDDTGGLDEGTIKQVICGNWTAGTGKPKPAVDATYCP